VTPVQGRRTVLALVAAVAVAAACGDDDTLEPAAPPPTVIDTETGPRPDGAGCQPGTDLLPDGRWFAFVESADLNGIEVDLACLYTGAEAEEAAAEDGEESPPPNDVHIRNADPLVRLVPVPAGTTVRWFGQPGDPATETETDYGAWVAARGGRDHQPPVWLVVEDGEVVAVEEQYLP
jgi:hypothetical protein